MSPLPPDRSDDSPASRYESRDVSPARVGLYGALGLIVLALLVGAVWLLLGAFDGQETEARIAASAAPVRTPAERAARADSLLSTYARTETSLVRIPIDRAMSLLLEEGFSVRPEPHVPPPSRFSESGSSDTLGPEDGRAPPPAETFPARAGEIAR